MSRLIASSIVALLALAGAAGAQTEVQQQGQATPDIVATKLATAHATVEAVDQANRKVTLKTDDGRELTVSVPETVRNFGQVEKGDQINIQYQEATAIFVKKPGESDAESAGTSTQQVAALPANNTQYRAMKVAPLGAKPAMVDTAVIETTATVEDIDYGKRSITLSGPQGNRRTIDVSDRVQNLDRIKKGDEIIVRHTEAIAASVTK